MAYQKRTLEELNVMDDFLFSALASDRYVGAPFCRVLLSALLQRSIGKIRVVAQHTVPGSSPAYRGIRMDVQVEEFENCSGKEKEMVVNVYDLEPHLQKRENLARHNRFYQAKIDSRYMSSGEDDFSILPNLYVITITDFDPFGENYMMYTVQNHCLEVPSMKYEDGVQFVYFYTRGQKGGSQELQELLRYLQNSTEQNVRNETIRKIHGFVNQVKVSPEVKQEYMTFEHYVWLRKQEAAQETQVENILEFLGDLGDVSEDLKKRLEDEDDIKKLRKWCKLAARAKSIQEFQVQLDSAEN